MSLNAGISRLPINPFPGVELAGWGYYIERKWERIRDDLQVTALVLEDGQNAIAILAFDLLVIDEAFTRRTRTRIQQATGIQPQAILLSASHSHNAPAAGNLLGVGVVNPDYVDWVSRQAAQAAISAWSKRQTVRLHSTGCEVEGLTFNRTFKNGPVDSRLTLLRLDDRTGRPLALVVNYQSHPTVLTKLYPTAVSRDVPGGICDILERTLPGTTALYLQGACGNVNFLPSFSAPERCNLPAETIAEAALQAMEKAQPIRNPTIASRSLRIRLPTRRWSEKEILGPLEEAKCRLEQNGIEGWLEGIGRAMTNRPEDMIARHGGDELKAVCAMRRFFIEWGELALEDRVTRPEYLETEVQGFRIGDLAIAAHSSELFVTFGLDLRHQCPTQQLMIAGYSNGRIGYVADARDIQAQGYAAYQSPKYCNQFPFSERSGPVLTNSMSKLLHNL